MKVVLSLSLSGTLLLFVLLLFKKLYKKKFTKRFQYYIWLIVLVRFLFPFSLETTLADTLLKMADTAVFKENLADSERVDNGNREWEITAAKTQMETVKRKTAKKKSGNQKSEYSQKAMTQEAYGSTGRSIDLSDVFSFLSAGWIVTAFLLFGRKVFVYRRFNRWLFKNNNKAEEKEQLDTLLLCREKLRIRRQVEVYGNPFIHSPILTGFFHPVIVVPAGRIPLEKLEFAFMHELIHLKRRDMFYKWLVQIVICIHWFNPFVYPLAREIEKACELSCDEAVVAAYDETAKKAYGDTLVSFIRAKTEGEASFAAVTLTEGVKQIEERLGEIMDYKKKSKGCRLCMIGFAAAVCVCFIAFGAYSVPAEAQESMLWERIRELEAGEEEQRELDKVEEQLREWEAQQNSAEDNDWYSYIQQAYYWDSYIIVAGWNLTEKAGQRYSGQREVLLSDHSLINVYFSDEIEEKELKNEEISAVSGLLSHLILQRNKEIKMPLISRITYVEEKEIPQVVETCYQTDDLLGFQALFPELDDETKKTYYDRIYEDGDSGFWAAATCDMNRGIGMTNGIAEKTCGTRTMDRR